MSLGPQEGPQTAFLSTPADIAGYGGAAGGGKSFGLLLEGSRHVDNKEFSGVIFRRKNVDIGRPGGLWDDAKRVYGLVPGAVFREQPYEVEFPPGSRIQFGHLKDATTVMDWHGAQLAFIGFDELTAFTRAQFFYMLSRNRSTCGVRPYVRATCNPDADSWVAEFFSWWIDPDTGFAIPERSGIIRYFVRVGDSLLWGDSPEELRETHPELPPKSVTFIPSTLDDNKILQERDPGYVANLMSLPTVERERLLKGNWKIRPSAGLYFQRSWCEFVDAIPAGTLFARGWDLAGTEKTADNDPDRTAGTKIGRMLDGRYIVAHHHRMFGGPAKVERAIKNFATGDGKECLISIPQDPGQAGKSQVRTYATMLDGWDVRFLTASGDKATRFGGFSAQAEVGNVLILRGPWNEEWCSALEAFPESRYDDDVDSTSEAYNRLAGSPVMNFTPPIVDSNKRQMPLTAGAVPGATDRRD